MTFKSRLKPTYLGWLLVPGSMIILLFYLTCYIYFEVLLEGKVK